MRRSPQCYQTGRIRRGWSHGRTDIPDEVTFSFPFSLRDIDGAQAGTYRIEAVDVALDILSFLAYRGVSTTIGLPAVATAGLRRQLVHRPLGLEADLTRDEAASDAQRRTK